MILRFLTALTVFVVLACINSSPAGAHALVQSTDPANNAVLQVSPSELALHFNEQVQASANAMQLYDSRGERIPVEAVRVVRGDQASVRATLKTLSPGGYVVAWRVTSVDSHPVRGAFTFQVGTESRTDTSGLVERLLTQGQGSQFVGALFGIARGLFLFFVAVMVGIVVFALRIDRSVASTRRIRRLAVVAAIGTALATLACIPLQGLYVAAAPLSAFFQMSYMREVLDSRYGTAALVRVVAVAMYLVAVFRMKSRASLGWMAAASLLVAFTLPLAGHGFAGRWPYFGTALDVVHVIGASAWVGGLVIVMALWASASDREAMLAKFSSLALIAVVAIVMSGLLQGWRQLGSIDALTSTDYGRLLIIKSSFVVVMIVLGGLVRRGLDRAKRVALLTRVELGLSVGVFVLTALLINAPPAVTETTKPVAAQASTNTYAVDLIVDPGRSGGNTVHVYVLSKSTGIPTDIPEISTTLSQPKRDVGPIMVPLQHVGSGHWASYGFLIPFSGDWQMDVRLRIDDVNVENVSAQIRVR